jgi:hypothetical protein
MTARLKFVNPPRASESHNTKLLRQREPRSLQKVGTSCPERGGSFVVLQKGIIERATTKERPDMNAKITTAANNRRWLKRISTSMSLVILTLGFSLLGLLTLINSNREGMVSTLSFENSSAVVGSSVSIVLGAAFLVAAFLYWSRYSQEFGEEE